MCVIHIVEYIPLGVLLPHIRNLLNLTPDRIVGAVVVPSANGATNSLLTAMLRVISRVGRGGGFTVTHTCEEAITLCEERLQQYCREADGI